MKNIFTVAPVNKPEDISAFVRETNCRRFYVFHDLFINNNFSQIEKFTAVAQKENAKIYVNFKYDITEEDVDKIKKFILFLTYTKIDGIFINGFTVLQAVKNLSLHFDVIADSYFDIHNLSGIDFVNSFRKTHNIIITEEVYIKNVTEIKQHTDMSLSVDSDNLPWCASELVKSNAIDSVIIKGQFNSSSDILKGIKLVEGIIKKPSSFKNKKLPFKHIRNCYYQTNHFSGEVINARGENFKFSKYIRDFEWKHKRTKLKDDDLYRNLKIPKINLRLTSLEQIKALERYIKKHKFNPVYSIEYGEIVSTSDLSVNSFTVVMLKVREFCEKYNIKLQYGTPRVLIERDFDRVYEDAKRFCLTSSPDSVIVNNLGFFWKLIRDRELKDIPVEIGSGINLLNSMSITCLNDLKQLTSVDFTTFRDINNIRKCIKRLRGIIPNKKLTVSGNIRVPSLGLCPLNPDPAIVSRLTCNAPCHKGPYALEDPTLNQTYPFITDGFCRLHMFRDDILNLCKYIGIFEEIGINEFVIDLSSLNAKFIPVLITNFLNALTDTAPTQLPILTEHLM